MGTMERMRQTSPYLLAIFAIVFVGFMVASDADVSNLLKSGKNYQTSPIAEVNGDDLLYKDFEKRVMEVQDQQSKQMQAQGQEVNIDYIQIRRQTWKEMIEDIMLRQLADEMGVAVTDKEMRYILLNNPPDFLKRPFTDSAGNFMRESYIEIMTNPDVIYQRLPENMSQQEKQRTVEQFRADVVKIEKALRTEKMRNNINTVVSTSLSFVSPLFAKEKYLAENSTAEVNFIYIDPNSVKQEDIKVSDEEIQEYYEKYKKLWPQKEKRKIKYIVFPMVPSQADTAKMMKAVAKLSKAFARAETPEEKSKVFSNKMAEYNGETIDFKAVQDIPPHIMPYLSNLEPNQIAGPIRLADGVYFFRLDEKRSGENVVVKASHILIGFGNNKDSAKALAQKVLQEAKSGNFAQLAMKYSSDRGSATKGGDLGYFGKGRMIPEFEKAAFGAKIGQVVGPVETQYGYHIIKVFDKKSDELKYSQIVLKPKMSRITKKGIARNAKEFKSRLEEGENFDDIAKSFNMTARETNYFERTLPVLGSNYLSAKAFELNVGDIIGPLDLKNLGVIVAQVSDIQQAGVTLLEAKRNKIEVILLEKKRVQAMKAKADKVYNEVKGLNTLLGYTPSDPAVKVKIAAKIKNNGVVPDIGLDYKFTAAAFKLPLNKISKPVEGDKSYYIIEVLNKNVPDLKTVDAQLKDFMIQLRNNFKSGSFYQWFNAYKNESDIKDFRTEFFKEF